MRWDGSNKFVEYRADLVHHKFEKQRPDVQEVPRHRSKKDKKRWCKGKVGVEHEVEVIYKWWFSCHRCKNCGKWIGMV